MMTGFGLGMGFVGLLLMVLFWGGLIAVAVWLVRAVFPSGGSAHSPENSGDTPHRILDQRYARGEITRQQYEQMKEDLT